MSKTTRNLVAATGLFALWMAATWWLEGRIETFRRPGAVFDRLVYTGVANIAIGIVGAALVLRHMFGGGSGGAARAGFGSPRRPLLWVPLGLALGLGLYFLQGAPARDPAVILNAYAQVFVVSAAEVAVCWAVIATVLRETLRAAGWVAIPVAALVASVLFGVYHFAHSPPFDTIGMVAFLALIGLLTSAFFFASGDVYATVVFHNFLGVFGVVQALAKAGRLESFQTLQVPLIATAVLAFAVMLACDALLLRRPGRAADR